MVSFTSLVVLSLAAAAQLASASVLPEDRLVSFVSCTEDKTLNKSNTVEGDHLVQDDGDHLTQFVAMSSKPNQSPTRVQLEVSTANGKVITTIQTLNIVSGQGVARIDWVRPDNKVEGRYFDLKENTKCRVVDSAVYKDIQAITYVTRK
jgi:hypothetical protein